MTAHSVETKITTKSFWLKYSDPLIGGLAELIKDPDVFPYEDIPGFPQSTVEGIVLSVRTIWRSCVRSCRAAPAGAPQRHPRPHHAGEVPLVWRISAVEGERAEQSQQAALSPVFRRPCRSGWWRWWEWRLWSPPTPGEAWTTCSRWVRCCLGLAVW